jgi:hypothetical protein
MDEFTPRQTIETERLFRPGAAPAALRIAR